MTTREEVTEIDQKLREMGMDVGVSFTTRELSVLRAMLKFTSELRGVPPGQEIQNDWVDFHSVVLRAVRPGFCYVKSMLSLPSLRERGVAGLQPVVEAFTTALGENPEGRDVILYLTLADAVLKGRFEVKDLLEQSPLLLLTDAEHLECLRKSTESKVRYTYSEESGLFHIDEAKLCCNCTEILCDHGWASRFILQVITRPGLRVGADVDLSALFMQIGDEEAKRDSMPRVEEVKEEQKRAELKTELDVDMCRMLEETLERRTSLLQQTFEQLLRSRENAESSESDDGACSTVKPQDSSSVLSRYKKSYMPEGTVYNFRRTRTTLEPLQEVSPLNVEKDVVQGFKKTLLMAAEEKDSVDRVYMINGLAAPMKNSRLNFLMHFHTALQECKFNPDQDPVDALESLSLCKPKNPTEELVKQVTQRTFDFEQMVVVANPFRLPFIEVGMSITDSIILKAFDLLRSEYRTLWFQEFKCLIVPPFHNEFLAFSTSVRGESRRRRSSTRSRPAVEEWTRAPSKAATTRSKQKRSSSILGFGTK